MYVCVQFIWMLRHYIEESQLISSRLNSNFLCFPGDGGLSIKDRNGNYNRKKSHSGNARSAFFPVLIILPLAPYFCLITPVDSLPHLSASSFICISLFPPEFGVKFYSNPDLFFLCNPVHHFRICIGDN